VPLTYSHAAWQGCAKWTRWYLEYRAYRAKGDFERQNEYLKSLDEPALGRDEGSRPDEDDEMDGFGMQRK
jgi:hypothetical protein